MAKTKTVFICQECGYESPKWLGRCTGCGTWNSLVEELVTKKDERASSLKLDKVKPLAITEVETAEEQRYDTGIRELNRVLGGGLVPGSLILVGGDPGIGKSTLLLQMAFQLAKHEHSVLYVTGEESLEQIRMRAERIGALHPKLQVVAETDLIRMETLVDQVKPHLTIVDSIQTMYHAEVSSAPGSVSQIKECTGYLLRLAKEKRCTVMIVGHVTKAGAIAGPRMLEHMVDSVLYFEGERHHSYRILRAVKNRYGSTNEMGVFEMREQGLLEVTNPSAIFLSERPEGVPGTAVAASMEGTRPVLVELQALVSPTHFAAPKRMATGVDHHRVSMMIAVLEKRFGLFLQNQDVYLNVVGGIRIDEPAVDLAIVISLASSFREVPTNVSDLFVGEVGLTGEVRGVSYIEQRIKEAAQMGFKRMILPSKNLQGYRTNHQLELIGISTVEEALAVALEGSA